MDKSAENDDGGLRERKRRATRASICTIARELTASSGLSGFTIEELCERVGISRRTFFNYFPSKEDAVLGHAEDAHLPEDLVADFLAGAGEVPLLEALRTFAQHSGERLALTREELAQLHAVMQREPEILARFFGESIEREREFAALIARRERMEPTDPRALLAAHVMRHIAWVSTHEFLSIDAPQNYRDILNTNIDAAGYLFR
ncbi:TetR family transcriptional regulator [Arthrobacter tumbae]|uniref:TetR/AcrR family transcriptional regulator n=1 Tax=Arthrobacter tumbae TaxID=163874 RepID=UPI00195DBD7A|nr:TetR family transcriptional regulator [Arthrobacter tumbae]MBM7782481.1 AcrR family transcriptional regulator [Arthrobacter tumbae]